LTHETPLLIIELLFFYSLPSSLVSIVKPSGPY
jgi:hypothetical protein